MGKDRVVSKGLRLARAERSVVQREVVVTTVNYGNRRSQTQRQVVRVLFTSGQGGKES
jgi:hypothetical protein